MSKASLETNNHFIPVAQAIEMTTLYRKDRESILNPSYAGKNILALSDTLPREVFETLLKKPGCQSLRIYYGMDAELRVHPLIVAVNENNEDILPAAGSGSTLGDGDDSVADDAMRCPPLCPPPSPLNGG